MTAKQLQYAIRLSEVLNFSQVAEQLNISQPALSKQVQSLEQELGVRLFDRSTNPLTLTAAGVEFVQKAEDLLFREDQLKRSMAAFQSGERGRLVIGISPFRSQYLIPPIAKKIRQQYPGVQIILHEAGSDTLRKEVAEGKYDFAIINLPVDESVLDTVPMEPDTLVLAVPNSMVDLLSITQNDRRIAVNMMDCEKLPFVVVGQNQEMRRLFDKLCATADIRPQIAMEVVGVATACAMCCAGIGATLLPRQFVDELGHDSGITVFKINNNIYSRQPAVVIRRGQYLSEYATHAIQLLTQSQERQ